MFFKKKPPAPVKKALPAPQPTTSVRSSKEKAEDDQLYQKIVQAFVDIQSSRGQSLNQTTHSLEKNKK